MAKGDYSYIFEFQKCLNERLEGLELHLVPYIRDSKRLAQYNVLNLTVRVNSDKYL